MLRDTAQWLEGFLWILRRDCLFWLRSRRLSISNRCLTIRFFLEPNNTKSVRCLFDFQLQCSGGQHSILTDWLDNIEWHGFHNLIIRRNSALNENDQADSWGQRIWLDSCSNIRYNIIQVHWRPDYRSNILGRRHFYSLIFTPCLRYRASPSDCQFVFSEHVAISREFAWCLSRRPLGLRFTCCLPEFHYCFGYQDLYNFTRS